jgi:hypothetical protein
MYQLTQNFTDFFHSRVMVDIFITETLLLQKTRQAAVPSLKKADMLKPVVPKFQQ